MISSVNRTNQCRPENADSSFEKCEQQLASLKVRLEVYSQRTRDLTKENEELVKKNDEQSQLIKKYEELVDKDLKQIRSDQKEGETSKTQKQFKVGLLMVNKRQDLQKNCFQENVNVECPPSKWSTAVDKDWTDQAIDSKQKSGYAQQTMDKRMAKEWSKIMDDSLWATGRTNEQTKTKVNPKSEQELYKRKTWSSGSDKEFFQQEKTGNDQIPQDQMEWPQCLKWTKFENDETEKQMLEEEEAEESKMPICAPTLIISGRIHKSIRSKEARGNDTQKTIAEKCKPDDIRAYGGGARVIYNKPEQNSNTAERGDDLKKCKPFCNRLECDFCLYGFLSFEMESLDNCENENQI